MKLTHCRDCQGTELYDTVLSARNGVIIGRKVASGDEWILVRCLICLACGYVMPYLNDDGLERLRHWAYEGLADNHAEIEAAQQRAAAPSPSPSPSESNPVPKVEGQSGFGTIVILCLILGTLLGLGVAVFGMMHE